MFVANLKLASWFSVKEMLIWEFYVCAYICVLALAQSQYLILNWNNSPDYILHWVTQSFPTTLFSVGIIVQSICQRHQMTECLVVTGFVVAGFGVEAWAWEQAYPPILNTFSCFGWGRGKDGALCSRDCTLWSVMFCPAGMCEFLALFSPWLPHLLFLMVTGT